MLADVQSWLNDPATKLRVAGIGGRIRNPDAKRFDTRESASPPVLTIQYRPAGPRPTPTPRPPSEMPRVSFAASFDVRPLFLVRYSSCYGCSHNCQPHKLALLLGD